MLSTVQRKRRVLFGAQRAVADACGVSEGLVSMVVKGTRRNREVERALWLRMQEPDGRPTHQARSLADVFGPVVPVVMRKARVA